DRPAARVRARGGGPVPLAERAQDHPDRLLPSTGPADPADLDRVHQRVRPVPDPDHLDHARPGLGPAPEVTMATTTTRRTVPEPSESALGRGRPIGGVELWAWLFMRISGLLLLVLAVGHTLIMHLPAGGVDRINFGFVAVRWQSPFWRTWDWMLLMLALLHGINGLRTITLDYVRPPGWRLDRKSTR